MLIHSPLVSVITVVYNGAKTLESTIKSVTTQTYPNIEYLVIDGGSNDGTIDIIKKYDRQINRWISEKDEGIYDAMNKGISMANGEFLCFLGSDDLFFDKEVVRIVFEDNNNRNADFIYGNARGASLKGVYDGEFTFEKLLNKNICHQTIFFRKQVFDRLGKYNKKYKTLADWEMNIRCFLQQDIKKKYVNLVIAQFGAGGVSAQHDPVFLRDIIIPEKLKLMNSSSSSHLYNIVKYDQWWRLIRNAAIKTEQELNNYVKQQPVPKSIKRIIHYQQQLPGGVPTGFSSKFLMFTSYLKSAITLSL